MSRISTRIRAYVDDPSVSDHYGEWGILRADQRRLIRKLCDVCDAFEKTADRFIKENERLSKANLSIIEHLKKARKQLKTAKAEAYKEFAEKSAMYMVQFGLDCIKQFVKNKTKLDPILAMTITEDELNEMYQTAKEYYESAIIDPDNILKEKVGEDK